MSKVFISGANRGIGLALVREFSKQGDEVFATARQPDSATELQELAAANPQVHVVAMDVTDDTSVASGVSAITAVSDELDLVINNAGVYPEGGDERFEEIDQEWFERAIDVNLLGTVRVTRALLPLVRKGNSPTIVNVSSGAASISRKSDGRRFCYGTSKAALNMFTRTLAVDLRSEGVVVVAISPGWVKTSMGGDQADLEVETVAPELVKTLKGLSMEQSGEFLDRFGTTETYAW